MKLSVSSSLLFIVFFMIACSGFQNLANSQQTYYWQEGDNLQKVAKKFGDSVLEIRRRNHIYEPEDLFVGFPLIVKPHPTIARQKPRSRSTKIRFGVPALGTITSQYGPRKNRFHYGVDFGSNKGKQVLAAESGVVRKVGTRSGYGNTIEILHQKNIITLYAHLEKTLVKRGQRVTKQQQIAIMGNTGRSTGVHLHFEVIINGTNIDPLKLIQ